MAGAMVSARNGPLFAPETYPAWHPLRFMARPGDGLRDVQMKMRLLIAALIGVVVNVIAVCTAAFGADAARMGTTTRGVFGANAMGFIGMAVLLVAKRGIPPAAVPVISVFCVLALCSTDLVFLVTGEERAWSTAVLLADALLVIRAPRHHAVCVLGAVCAWVAVTGAELTYRFGLADVPGVMGYEERRARVCCERPPCAGDGVSMMRNSLFMMGVVVVDFLLTRGFADSVQQERDAMVHAAEVTERVARCLAQYDLENAYAHLDRHSGGSLPCMLAAPLMQILDNLRAYKPYLPSALVPATRDAAREAHNPLVPGDGGLAAWISDAAHCRAALVATGIRQWDALQEHSAAAAVREACGTYGEALRRGTETHGGYSVKAVGDFALMAFHTSAAAVRFGIGVQEALSGDVWGALSRPGAGEDGFGVVSVRVGVDAGEVTLDRNRLTGRCEFFGGTVRRATQAGEVGLGGVVTVTARVHLQLSEEEVLEREQLFGVMYSVSKAAGETLWLYALVPRGATERAAFVRAQCGSAAAPPGSPVASRCTTTRRRRRDSCGLPPSGSSSPSAGGFSAPSTITLEISDGFEDAGLLSSHTLRERTTREAATVGVVRFAAPCADGGASWEHQEAALTAQLQAMHEILEETSGHLSLVLNDVAVVSWGMHGRCEQHENESARFLLRMNECCGGGAFQAGLATGPMACGVVTASDGHRHITPMGPWVTAALQLCAGAVEMQTQVLIAWDGADGHWGLDLRDHLLPVDAIPGVPSAVYELDLKSLSR